MQITQKDEIRRLMTRVAEIADSSDNRRKTEHWKRYFARVPSSEDPEGSLFTIDIGIPTWSRILGFNLIDYFTDPVTHLRSQLLIRIYHHENFCDDTVVTRSVGVPAGGPLEPSLLGVETVYRPDTNPWASRERAIVADADDLDRFPMPDFYRSGPMPRIHQQYREYLELIQELGDGSWQVGFPAPIRGVLGLAQTIRGPHENILIDMLERPEFARRLFRLVTDFRRHYSAERARFLQQPIGRGHIGNDEVTVPNISPRLYEEFLLPFETEISEFHGGLSCWHSCGDTTRLLGLIKQIPRIAQFYTGPWTDVEAVMSVFGVDTPIDIAVHVVDDILAATPEHMEAKLRRIIAVCDGAALKIRGGAIDSIFDLQRDLAQMRQWTQVAQQVTRSEVAA